MRSSRWEDPRAPVGAATRGAFQPPPRGAVPAPCSGPRKGVEGSTGTRDKDMRHGAVTGRGGEMSDPSTQLTGRGDTLATLKGTWGDVGDALLEEARVTTASALRCPENTPAGNSFP